MRDSDARLPRLVCLPHAGGSAFSYQSWPARLADVALVTPVSLPGRADRCGMPPVRDLPTAADLLAGEFANAGPGSVALFGYSLGALVAFEAARRMTAAGRPPLVLIAGACAPPATRGQGDRHLLPDRKLMAWVKEMGAVPESVLDDPDMVAILLPMLRADIALSERYRYQPAPPLPVPIVTIAGQADPDCGPGAMAGWSAESEYPLREFTVAGGHMFIEHQQDFVIGVLRTVLMTSARHRYGQLVTGQGHVTG